MSAHREYHFRSSALIRDIVIGMSDGLTVPFALAAGLSGAVSSNGIIVTAGAAEIIAGSIAMGLGGFLAGRTDAEHYASELRREYDEVERVPDREKAEIREIFADYGLSIEAQNLIADELAKDKKKWVDFMMKFELGLEEPEASRARISAVTIALSYIAGGLIPLSAYFFTATPQEGLLISAAVTLLSLFIFGFYKAKLTGQHPFTGAVRVMLIGALASGAAYLIARQFD